ncbi:MAG TPA: rRNA maturation RNase YbeY [Candidatus Cloacimonadota bacterium]|nr:rRNA maturation RNase YbeY [Candidatus Cloacimonadota bacterium]
MNTPNSFVEIDNQAELDLTNETFNTILQIVVSEENLSTRSFLSLRLSNDGQIKKLNARYRGKDELTDVLSFKAEIPGVPFLGDIIIDTNVAAEQKENRSLMEELSVLFLHGLLHLLDYDHLSAEQQIIMKNKEIKYINLLKEKI